MGSGRLRRLTATLAVAVVVVTGACSDDDDGGGSTSTSTSRAGPTTSAAVATTVASATTVPPAATTTAPDSSGGVTIRGTVLTLFASARVLQIDPPVSGYSRVALTDETEYRRADGSAASLQDVEEGATVEVTGEPGAPGTLIARAVVLTGG